MQKKKALITGSSRGIGRAIALALAEEGFEVILHCAANVEKAEAVKGMIKANGGTARIVQADLGDLDGFECVHANICTLVRDFGG